MTDSPSRDNHDTYDDAVHTVAELLEADFGDWELATVRELVASRPGWEQGKVYDGQE
jgi:broad specificity phosphatase PhoE